MNHHGSRLVLGNILHSLPLDLLRAVVFTRFVVATSADNPWRAAGLFGAAYLLVEEPLHPDDAAELDATLNWFREHLPVPPFRKRLRQGRWTEQAICWYLADAVEPMQKMWDLIRVLKRSGEKIRMLQTAKPGRIVYRDGYQIVAEVPRRAYAGLVCAAI